LERGRRKPFAGRLPSEELDLAMPHLTAEAANAILRDNFAPWLLASGLTVQTIVAEGARLRLPFSAELCRAGAILCGQALISAADSAMVIALAATQGAFKPCTTVDLSISYMRPISQADALLAAKLMRLGKMLAFCSCALSEATTGKPAAFATGTYALLG
jgi:acyl-coenzyme A thioesterase PaaI-like protein